MKRLPILLSLFVFVSISYGQAVELVLGDPSPDQGPGLVAENIVVKHRGFILSFNTNRLSADWVAWHVQSSDLGSVNRTNSFRPDQKLPSAYRVGKATFGQPYDRGHVCPSGDRTNTVAANSETYVMSNMQPQHKFLNQQAWKKFEDFVRSVVRKRMEAYTYAGCAGGDQKLANGMTIPTHCWKVVLFLEQGRDDLARINGQTRVIAIDMPNDGSTRGKSWETYQTTVAELEAKTGLTFFRTVPDDIASQLKSAAESSAPRKENAVRKMTARLEH